MSFNEEKSKKGWDPSGTELALLLSSQTQNVDVSLNHPQEAGTVESEVANPEAAENGAQLENGEILIANGTAAHDTQQDDPNKIPEDMGFLWSFFIFLGIFFFLFDIGTDVYIATDLYNSGKMAYFACTLVFVIPSILITNLLCLFWYLEALKNENAPALKHPKREWTIRAIFLVCQLGPVLRYIDTYRFGRRSNSAMTQKDKKLQYVGMTYEREDGALLRLFECFLESAPQMILQIYIMTDPDTSEGSLNLKFVSCTFSLCALSYALMSNQRAMRLSHSDEGVQVMSWTGSIFQFCYYAFLILPRVMVFGLFATISHLALALTLLVHFLVMLFWIYRMDTSLSENKWIAHISRVLFGLGYVFCYINLDNTPSRRRLTWFHSITMAENMILILVWYFLTRTTILHPLSIVLAVVGSYVLGLLLMIVYYQFFHPNKKNIKPVF